MDTLQTALVDERTAKETFLVLKLASLLHDLPDDVLYKICDKVEEYENMRKECTRSLLQEIFVFGE